ncbi:LANO_0H07954g1_1 [Lachancea nothofagi CBS 11611]|uniref:LANO_0H07954g1_1 n=1 Tax=Lachancea nothofagi CBS 11611 TaxID=1266666 RepID=A0A1G4KLP5_9SACH|nr:LANO_0H07954g1_1 [Lachancea nothofagi CBS 11611]
MSDGLSSLQREILAGLTAGTVTTIATHPLDLIKLRLQLLATTNSSLGYAEVIRTIVGDSKKHNNVIREAYRGLGVNLLGNSLAWGLYFGLYRYSKDLVFKLWIDNNAQEHNAFQNDSRMGPLLYLTSAALSGVTTAVLTNPLWVVKTRLMSTSAYAQRRYKSTWDGIVKIYEKEGYQGFWRGLTPSLFGVAQGAIYFAAYDSLKHRYFARKGIRKEEKLGNAENIGLTSVSKMVSVTAVYPLQLLKSNLQSFDAIENRKTYKLWTLVQSIYGKDGIRGLYKGLSANLLRAIPSTCITFCIYENLRHWL